jgi:HAD superfamily hydrolase (TIGR01549 family)
MKDIKNIIFDLGGVIINLDLSLTISKFNLKSQVPFESIYSQANQIELFNEFDKKDVPEKRLDLLVRAKQNYNTFLLSNTCEPHIEEFEQKLYLDHGVKNFNDYFDKTYYSCRIGMRKPDRNIFELVLAENNLDPKETIFIDDSEQHVRGAGECGINAYLLPKNMELISLLNELNLL